MPDEIKFTKKIDAFNDDIPYEVRMKYIIEAYSRDLKRLEALKNYAIGLEEENCLLTKKLEKAESFLAERRESDATIKKMQIEINRLKGTLTKMFPQRVVKLRNLKRRLVSMAKYISALQALLRQNGIPYEECKAISNSSDQLDIENLNIFAVRGPNDIFEVTEE